MKLNSPVARNSNISVRVVLSSQGQSLFCGRETGHSVLPPTSFEILLIFFSGDQNLRDNLCTKPIIPRCGIVSLYHFRDCREYN